ncbi:hypothetical protein [Amycolatopsis sp. NPDC059021]|uniref:hypothetical protein n=1 Tax=Amycolatopsis sp. NPDC059021 TaxID=3346704 RepID=UPI00366FF520
MDPADAFVNLYDRLRHLPADLLSDWSELKEVQKTAADVCAEVGRTGVLAEHWLSSPAIDQPEQFGILLGLDLALLGAVGETASLDARALDYLQVRLEMTGRLNEQSSGILLPRRSSAHRPGEDPDSIDGFLHMLRIPSQLSENLQLCFVHTLYDLPKAPVRHGERELTPTPPPAVAQLPLLAERADVRWDTIDKPGGAFYTAAPEAARLEGRLGAALTALDQSGAVLAVLPEGCLDDGLLEKWRELLRATPQPEDSSLTWLLLGTGPVRAAGPMPVSGRPPNRAVLLHRGGWLEPFLTQDKLSGFCFTTEKQAEYGIDLGGVKRDEYISHDPVITLLEARSGRFAVQICEDVGRQERQRHLIAAGVTHLLVPVLAAPMWEHGWQASAGQALAVEIGTKAVVSNGLAITRFFEEEPAKTLLVTSVPPRRPEQYPTTKDMVRTYHNPDAAAMTAVEDALTPRQTGW